MINGTLVKHERRAVGNVDLRSKCLDASMVVLEILFFCMVIMLELMPSAL